MDSSFWLDRLYADESLTDNLEDPEAELLLRWGESRLLVAVSDQDAEALLAMIREVNRRVGEGEAFEPLMAHLASQFPIDESAAESDPNEPYTNQPS